MSCQTQKQSQSQTTFVQLDPTILKRFSQKFGSQPFHPMTMSQSNVKEFVNKLEKCNYNIEPDELRELTEQLVSDERNRYSVLYSIMLELQAKNYQAKLLDNDRVLDVYLGFSGLEFSINKSAKLTLIEEMWYHRGRMVCDKYEYEIGEPTSENVEKVIKLYNEKGRGADIDNSTIQVLIDIEKSEDNIKKLFCKNCGQKLNSTSTFNKT